MFLELKAASTSVERTLGSSGVTKFRYIIFVIIESGTTLFIIQLVRMVLWVMEPNQLSVSSSPALYYVLLLGEMFNVIIRSVHFYSFCVTEKFNCLGHHTNNNFGADLNEVVLR